MSQEMKLGERPDIVEYSFASDDSEDASKIKHPRPITGTRKKPEENNDSDSTSLSPKENEADNEPKKEEKR